jgi:tetratricopeptide (TPR) repeat protein
MAIAARVVGDAREAAILAALDMAAKRRRAAGRDRADHAPFDAPETSSVRPFITLAAEGRAGDLDHALAILDEALATCDRTDHRAFEAELHRARGEMLMRDPANRALAEEALLTAIEVAKDQIARSFQLRAALSLAKLYQLTGRLADAHSVLTPALEGFAPTPEMPEIAEAQALLAALADSEEVKADAARRQQRLHLQTGYAQAVGFSRGFLANATRAAFEQAGELASREGGGKERFAAYYAGW